MKQGLQSAALFKSNIPSSCTTHTDATPGPGWDVVAFAFLPLMPAVGA